MAGRHSNNSSTLMTSLTPWQRFGLVRSQYIPPSPLTLVTSASDTNPLSLQSISVHIRRRSARCSAVRRYGSRALIRSQLMMVGAAMARVVTCHAPSRVTRWRECCHGLWGPAYIDRGGQTTSRAELLVTSAVAPHAGHLRHWGSQRINTTKTSPHMFIANLFGLQVSSSSPINTSSLATICSWSIWSITLSMFSTALLP